MASSITRDQAVARQKDRVGLNLIDRVVHPRGLGVSEVFWHHASLWVNDIRERRFERALNGPYLERANHGARTDAVDENPSGSDRNLSGPARRPRRVIETVPGPVNLPITIDRVIAVQQAAGSACLTLNATPPIMVPASNGGWVSSPGQRDRVGERF